MQGCCSDSVDMRLSAKMPMVFINTELRPEIIKKLDKKLSYDVPSCDHVPSFLDGRWDGREHLLKRTKSGSYYFPVGLLISAVEILQAEGMKVNYFGGKVPTKKFYWDWRGPTLWDHQRGTIEAATKRLNSARGVVLHLPTAAGKTTCAIRLMVNYGVKTIILVRSKELATQWDAAIEKMTTAETVVWSEGEAEKSGNIVIAMIQTIASKIKNSMDRSIIDKLKEFEMLIVDECHHCPAKETAMISNQIPAYLRIGLTATPRREDNAMLKMVGCIGEMINPVTASDLIEKGVLAKPEFKWIKLQQLKGYRGRWQQEYKANVVLNEERNQKIKEIAEEEAGNGEQVYIHVTQVAHGKMLAGKIGGAIFLCGSDAMSKREDVIEKFSKGEIKILVSTLLGEGVDIPSMSVFINAAGGKSEISTIQRVGRVLRSTKNKKSARVYDFVDSGYYLRRHAQDRLATYQETFGCTSRRET